MIDISCSYNCLALNKHEMCKYCHFIYLITPYSLRSIHWIYPNRQYNLHYPILLDTPSHSHQHLLNNHYVVDKSKDSQHRPQYISAYQPNNGHHL